MLGETIGNFKIVRRLGRGGMGEVWLAEQQNLGTKVAVKVLLDAFPADSEDVQRFFNEARAVSVIQHSGIVKIFDSGLLPDGRAYMVMEYLDGESLAQRIARGGMMASELAEIGRQIASVLDATHTAGIIHRDLKPENVFLIPDLEMTGGERVKVLDFGVAKLNGLLGANSPKTFGTLGTPNYMAPEQWGDASQVDGRVDLYALGCLTFEMATGRPPFVCKTVAEACARHLNDVPPRASSMAANVSPQLDRLIAQLLEKQPENRPRSMREVARTFDQLRRGSAEGVLETLPSGSTPSSRIQNAPTERMRSRGRGLVIAAAVVLLGGGATAIVALRKEPAKPIEAVRPMVTAIVEDAALPAHQEHGDLAALVATTVKDVPADAAAPRPIPRLEHVAPKIDRDAVLAAIAAHRGALQACNAHRTTNARLELALTIGLDGRASKLSASGSDALAGCALGVVRTIVFPKPIGGNVDLTMPLVFAADVELPDHLSRELLTTGLLLAEKQLDACMAEHHVEVKTIVTISVSPAGRVTATTVVGDLAGSPFEGCVARVMRTIEFAPAVNGTSLTVPITP